LENTYCPDCGYLLIERLGFRVRSNLREKLCPGCGSKLEGFIL